MGLELWYFKVRGRGEQIKLLLAELGVEYENKTIGSQGADSTFDDFKKTEPRISAFGSVPSIVDGNFRLSQGPAILSYIGTKYGKPLSLEDQQTALSMALGAEDLRIKYFSLFGEGSEKKQSDFVNDIWKPRWGPNLEYILKSVGGAGFVSKDNITFGDVAMWDALNGYVEFVKGFDFEGLPLLKKFYEDFKNRPNIKSYLESDKRAKG
eukprot:TRINITY_DN29899_c0_g1_i1.p1 TRINITY_DN29899_c0_g1~~TRINITY_DN29899_c0_g1_i1.p1  ORF type:complete len:209 (+),score=37.76 TRINITY_DN29899_c0_g1_i1:50-676(+)